MPDYVGWLVQRKSTKKKTEPQVHSFILRPPLLLLIRDGNRNRHTCPVAIVESLHRMTGPVTQTSKPSFHFQLEQFKLSVAMVSSEAATLVNIALDLQILICTFLHPFDILALRQVCHQSTLDLFIAQSQLNPSRLVKPFNFLLGGV